MPSSKLRTNGVYVRTMPDGREIVRETFTCPHCNTIQVRRKDVAGYCASCHADICVGCGKRMEINGERCEVFEKKLERIEGRDRLLRSMGIQ